MNSLKIIQKFHLKIRYLVIIVRNFYGPYKYLDILELLEILDFLEYFNIIRKLEARGCRLYLVLLT